MQPFCLTKCIYIYIYIYIYGSVTFYEIIVHLLVIAQNKKKDKREVMLCSQASGDTEFHSMGRGSNPGTLKGFLFNASLKDHCLNF